MRQRVAIDVLRVASGQAHPLSNRWRYLLEACRPAQTELLAAHFFKSTWVKVYWPKSTGWWCAQLRNSVEILTELA